MLGVAVPYLEFWAYWYMTRTDTLTKVLDNTLSDRQTDQQKLWLYLAAF